MLIIIQLLVVIAALYIVRLVLVGGATSAARAWKKLALILLPILMIIGVLFPQLVDRVANFVGVGRGADLLLYLLTVAFIVYVLNDYIRRQRERDRIFRLARKISLLEANFKYGHITVSSTANAKRQHKRP